MALSFQDIIFKLQQFWAQQECVILQPLDMEVGAGTFHPATTLKALGSEAWKAAFVQPCRRPTDGRFGENPNRLQQYYQFQVVLKPSPDNIQQLYLQSLSEIGIDLKKNDIRFVEDNWESPTLGAWGLGWEVWCNGMEITQFTYFQQVGGFDCSPITGEITYGLERLAMFVQNVDNVFDIDFNGAGVSYGDIFQRNEFEQSTYNFYIANVDHLLSQFNMAEKQCLDIIKYGHENNKNLPLPAFEQCIKASHIFNILDARGAVSVNQRQQYILKIRAMAKNCAEAWLNLYKTK